MEGTWACPLQWEYRVLTTGLPGKSPGLLSLLKGIGCFQLATIMNNDAMNIAM